MLWLLFAFVCFALPCHATGRKRLYENESSVYSDKIRRTSSEWWWRFDTDENGKLQLPSLISVWKARREEMLQAANGKQLVYVESLPRKEWESVFQPIDELTTPFVRNPRFLGVGHHSIPILINQNEMKFEQDGTLVSLCKVFEYRSYCYPEIDPVTGMFKFTYEPLNNTSRLIPKLSVSKKVFTHVSLNMSERVHVEMFPVLENPTHNRILYNPLGNIRCSSQHNHQAGQEQTFGVRYYASEDLRYVQHNGNYVRKLASFTAFSSVLDDVKFLWFRDEDGEDEVFRILDEILPEMIGNNPLFRVRLFVEPSKARRADCFGYWDKTLVRATMDTYLDLNVFHDRLEKGTISRSIFAYLESQHRTNVLFDHEEYSLKLVPRISTTNVLNWMLDREVPVAKDQIILSDEDISLSANPAFRLMDRYYHRAAGIFLPENYFGAASGWTQVTISGGFCIAKSHEPLIRAAMQLIEAHPFDNSLFVQQRFENYIRTASRATLIICDAIYCSADLWQSVQLKVHVIVNKESYRKVSLRDVLVADIVVVSVDFLKSENPTLMDYSKLSILFDASDVLAHEHYLSSTKSNWKLNRIHWWRKIILPVKSSDLEVTKLPMKIRERNEIIELLPLCSEHQWVFMETRNDILTKFDVNHLLNYLAFRNSKVESLLTKNSNLALLLNQLSRFLFD